MKGFESKFDKRLEALASRRTPAVEDIAKSTRYSGRITEPRIYRASPIYEVYQRLGEHGSAVRYAVGAMQPVDPGYTEITYAEGHRVQNQLEKVLIDSLECEYEFQGSVTNNTHIKAYSDIDLLAIIKKFVTLEQPQVVESPYNGDPVEDLRAVRTNSCDHLKHSFPKADVDDGGSKSISISGGSLRRNIDIVPANWYNTNRYAESQAKRFRAVQILDCKSQTRIKNMPFLHNYEIEMKDRRVQGGMRKVARLLKSLKYDSGTVALSSYDIVSLAYNMNDSELFSVPGFEVQLLLRAKRFLDQVANDIGLREALLVPDQSRCIFARGHATTTGLDQLRAEVDELIDAIRLNLHRDFSNLAEARVAY